MMLADRIAKWVPQLPPELKQLLDAELAAGSSITDVEIGRGEQEGKVAIILQHPFRTAPSAAPAGLLYREPKNRDILLYEFYVPDERFSLVTAKFKPMKFEKITGPTAPVRTKEQLKADQERAAFHDAAAKQIAAQQEAMRNPPKPATPIVAPPAKSLEPAETFIASMTMTYDMWHDGLGYDLAALAQLSPAQLRSIETTLINRQPKDWRDIEALAHIDSPRARAEVEAALKSSDANVRREARKHVGPQADQSDRERLLIQSLEKDEIYTGLSQSIDDAADFHPPAVVEALLRGALNRDGGSAVHFAALLYFIHDKADEPFDWEHRSFFLRFNTEDRAGRVAVFEELCATIGVDAAKYVE